MQMVIHREILRRVFIQRLGQFLQVLELQIISQLEIVIVGLLERSETLMTLLHLHQHLHISYQVQQLLVLLVVVEGDDGDAVLQLVEV